VSYYTKEKLYGLLPAIYRQQDVKIGKPLEALVSLIAEQVEILEKDIENLYDNWFIETCDEWLVPYIGDLVGAMLLVSIEKATVSQRAWVANTIRYRRRKGTIFVLEQIARDVTGWNSKAVEFFQLLATTQYISNHLRPANYFTPDLRDGEKLELLGTPFDTISHTLDVRNIKSGLGYYNIPNIGLFLWRLQAYPVYNSPAYDHNEGRYSFSQLGFDMQLFNSPITETGIEHLAEEIHVPSIIRRSALKNRLDKYYGSDKSILVEVDGSVISADHLVICNLDKWIHRPPQGNVAIDPLLGRIAFPTSGTGAMPAKVRVSYYYGFSADMGGGFYDREELETQLLTGVKTYKVSRASSLPDVFSTIFEAISQWQNIDNRPSAVFEIMDSEFYTESFVLTIPEKSTLIIRSAANQRPVLKAGADPGTAEQFIEVTGEKESKLILDGLLVDKSLGIKINPGDLSLLNVNHCTFVPRISASLKMDSGNDNLLVTLRHSITGKITLTGSEGKLISTDTIIDIKAAGAEHQDIKPDDSAIRCFSAKIENSTIFGKVNIDLLELASNSIFTGTVKARRRQQGCVRFSYIPEGSEVPRCYHCQPHIRSSNLADSIDSNFTKVHPWFTSENYGDPGYAQLHKYIAPEIFEGADNNAEMGAFNSLYEPQRIKNLESSLDEYLRFGLEGGIIAVDENGGN
jgi:hypothetical protein